MSSLRRRLCFVLLAAVLAAGLSAVAVAPPLAAQEPSPAAGEEPPQEPSATAETEPAAEPAAQPETAAESAPAAGQAPGQQPAAAARPEAVRFELPVPEDQGGGTVTGVAEGLDFQREDYVVLTGSVEASYQDIEITAERIAVDLGTNTVTAEGEVILDQGPRRVTGATLVFDLETKTGTLTEATAYVAPDYYFQGAEVAKVDDDVYTVTDGMFTSCSGDEVPDWSFRVGTARVTVDGYARAKNVSMRVKKAPVLYTPYLLWPVKSERTSGLLVPNIGYSERRGAYLGLAYYQVLGRSYDTTFLFDGYSEGYVGFGNELRYRPTAGTEGELRGYIIDDQDDDEWRWKLELDHVTEDLPWGMRGAATLRKTSDFDFFRDFERDFDRASRRFEESRAFVSGNWGPHLLNIEATERETFFTGAPNGVDRRLPEIEYRLRSTELGNTPLVLKVDSSLGYLSVDRSAAYQSDYGRFDVQPELSLPLSPVPWLSVSVYAGQRYTWWGDSVDASRTSFTGDSVDRSVTLAGADVIGPTFLRVFGGAGSFSKLMHVIEPRLSYGYSSDYDEQSRVPSFDGVDGYSSGNVGTVSLINRLKAKPKDESLGGSRDIVTFELSRRYSFDDDRPLERGDGKTSKAGPFQASLRVNPSRALWLEGSATYSALFDQLTSTSLATDLHSDRASLGLRWNSSYRNVDGERLSDQLRVTTRLDLLPGRLGLRASVDYDLKESELQEQRYFIDYDSQCFGIRFEVRDYRASGVDELDYRLAFSLKNVGTFLDLTGRYE